MGKYLAKRHGNARRNILYILLAVLILLGGTAGVFGKYVAARVVQTRMHAAGFYVSSDYLALNGMDGLVKKEVPVSGWREDGIRLELYNYEALEEALQITGADMTFTYEVSGGWEVAADKASLPADQRGILSVTLTPPADAKKGDEVTLTVTTAPYQVKMEAVFTLTDADVPDYIIEDKGAYEKVTIHSNDYQGPVTVSYNSDALVPDRTNALMKNFSGGEGTITVKKFQTYELMFFEEVPGTYVKTEGTGTAVPVN